MEILPGGDEVIVAFPAARNRVPMATQFRSTWLAGSLYAMRERGLYDRYVAALNPDYVETITQSVAGIWLPIDVAMAHYEACDRLDLAARDQIELGALVMRHTHGTILSVAMRLAARSGLTPWTIFGQSQRLWDRSWVGAAVGVWKTGPREVRIELVGFPCARFTYCRVALRGILVVLTELFCDKAYVSDIPNLWSSTSVGFRVAWV
jgi:hypothetical protein